MSGTSPLSAYLDEVMHDWQNTRSNYPKNLKPKSQWPIPFFGSAETATVATVGVNPSSTEFDTSRGWDSEALPASWKNRLQNYFRCCTPAHKWFDSWQIALEYIGADYEKGTAAHFDVSYRSTTAMLRNHETDRTEFRRMVESDVRWFFKLLPLCPHLRLLLVFGPIIGANGGIESLMSFLLATAPAHGFTLVQGNDGLILQHPGSGKEVFIHEADTPGESCVTSRVVRNLRANREKFQRLLVSSL